MHGIVLWVNQKSKSALIWCEDHKGLATYTVPDNGDRKQTIDSGDLVEFEVIDQGEFRDRKAINLRINAPKLAADLPEKMNTMAKRQTTTVQSVAEFGRSKVELIKR